jgi:hypothetical protein
MLKPQFVKLFLIGFNVLYSCVAHKKNDVFTKELSKEALLNGIWIADSIIIADSQRLTLDNFVKMQINGDSIICFCSSMDKCGYKAIFSITSEFKINYIYCPITINTQRYSFTQEFKKRYFYLNVHNVGNGTRCNERKQYVAEILNTISNYIILDNKLILYDKKTSDKIILHRL